MIVGARRGGSSNSCPPPGFLHGLKHLQRMVRWTKPENPVSGSFVADTVIQRRQKRMGRLVQANRKSTNGQITGYNSGVQKGISECTALWTLKTMGYSSRRPCQVPLLSANNKKLKLQWAQIRQNWTAEKYCLAEQILISAASFLDPFCLVSAVQAAGGGVMVWWMLSWHTLGPLMHIQPC